MATNYQQQPYIASDGNYTYATGQPQQTQQVVYTNQQPQQTGGYPVAHQPQHQNVAPQYHARARNACMQCGELYPLPQGASSWRCRKCGHFNDLAPTCCVIL
mmetsp:Transcript_277/g.389  ORF Transcript_277/g.389 Transcript_277/m.389 type:complete len:102 (-) Transcript_277:340-645(-)